MIQHYSKNPKAIMKFGKAIFFYLLSLCQLPFNFYFIEESCAISTKVPIQKRVDQQQVQKGLFFPSLSTVNTLDAHQSTEIHFQNLEFRGEKDILKCIVPNLHFRMRNWRFSKVRSGGCFQQRCQRIVRKGMLYSKAAEAFLSKP